MSKTEFKVRELVDMIEFGGRLRLPEIQRWYVWTQTKVRDLLHSLYRDYPSGISWLERRPTIRRSRPATSLSTPTPTPRHPCSCSMGSNG